MYQMSTFSLLKYQIFPLTWVIMSFTALKKRRRNKERQKEKTLRLSLCNSKIIKILQSYTWENQVVDNFLILNVKAEFNLNLQSKPHLGVPQEWSMTTKCSEQFISELAVFFLMSSHQNAALDSLLSGRTTAVSPTAQSMSKIEHNPLPEIRISQAEWDSRAGRLFALHRWPRFDSQNPHGVPIFTSGDPLSA